MEKGPEIRIVGRASAEKKEQVRREVERALFSHFESLSPREKEQFKKFEYPKSEKELALINFVNEETSRLMREAGIEPYDIPAENYHIIPPELYKKVAGDDGIAAAFSTRQGIIFDAQYFRDNPVNFGAVALHESLHLKAYFSIEVQEESSKVSKASYREGVVIQALQSHRYHGKYHQHFAGLDEAIVAETEKRLLAKLLDHPELATEKEWLMSDKAMEMRRKLAKERKIPEDDIFWVGEEDNNCKTVPYFQQRNVLNYVCVEIQKQFPNEYQSADDVYKIFLKAHFTGQLLPLGRLVEKTFGEESFRLLGNMDTNSKSGVLHLESLKKARARQTREKITTNMSPKNEGQFNQDINNPKQEDWEKIETLGDVELLREQLEQAQEKVRILEEELKVSNATIEELEKRVEEAEKNLIHDPLTNLKTRRYFIEETENNLSVVSVPELEKRKEGFSAISFLYCDVDYFKTVNDTYGHSFGDEILKKVSQIIEKNIRNSDTACRWGGEEIVVSLLGTDEQEAKEVAEKIRKAVQEEISQEYGDNPRYSNLRVSLSIGVSSYEKELDLDQLINQADEAMFLAKKEKNCVKTYSDVLAQEGTDLAEI